MPSAAQTFAAQQSGPVFQVTPTVISACGSTLLDVNIAGFPVGNVSFQLSSSSAAAVVSLVRSINATNPSYRIPKFMLPSWPAASSFVTLTATSASDPQISFNVSMFVQPCWNAAAPVKLPIQSTSPITIHGSGFIPARLYICRFTLSSNPSVIATSASPAASFSLLSCSIPSSLTVGGKYILGVIDSVSFSSVDRDGGVLEMDVLEAIASVSPLNVDASSPGVLTVTGSGFNAASSYSCSLINAQGQVLKSTSVAVSSSALACTFPSWQYQAGAAQLQVNRGDVSISNQLPQLNLFASWISVSPQSAPVAGGSFITVSGSGFLASVSYQCNFSAMGATILSAAVVPSSSSVIVCASPKWTGSSLSAVLELVSVLGGQIVPLKSGSSSSFLFTFENWLSLSPISGPVTGGIPLTVSGAGFSTDGSAQYVCAFQFSSGPPVVSPIATIVSSGRLTCQLPALVDRPHGAATFIVRNSNTSALIGYVGSNMQFLFTPVISSYSPNRFSIVNASLISISGVGFDVNKSYSCLFKTASSGSLGSTTAVISSSVSVSCPSLLTSAFRPVDALLTVTDGFTESNAVSVTFMPSLISIHPSVICYSPSASVTVFGTGFEANEQYILLLDFQPVDDNFLQSAFPGTYTLARNSVSIRASSTSQASMLIFEITSGTITTGAVDIKVSLRSESDLRAFLNTIDLFPSLYGRSSCASVSISTGTSISASGGTTVTASVLNGVYPKLLGSPDDWISKGVGFQNSFQCIFASRTFVTSSAAVVSAAGTSSSNVIGSVTFQCPAPQWLSSASSVRIFIRFQALFLPVPFFIGSVSEYAILEAVASVSPSSVPYNGGNRLTVSGYGFVSSGSLYQCSFNNILSSVIVQSPTSLSCLSPVFTVLPAQMVFTVRYANGAPVSMAPAATVVFSASILSVLSPQTPIANASVTLSVGGLSSIDFSKYNCVISFVSPPAIYEVVLVAAQSSSTSLKCDTSRFPEYAANGQIYGGSAIITVKRLDPAQPMINGFAAVTFLGSITSIIPNSSSNPSKFITVTGNGFIPGVNTPQVCSFQSTTDTSVPITSATVGLTLTSSLICSIPSLPSGRYSLSIRSGSQLVAVSFGNIQFAASAEWAAIAPDSFSAMGGSVFSIVGSSFSLRDSYTVKFYADDVHYVDVAAFPVSASVLSGYSPAWPFPAARVTVSVEYQGEPLSSFRRNASFYPEISSLQTLSDAFGPFLFLKASGLSPIDYTCTISDIRTGLSIQTKGSQLDSKTLACDTSLITEGQKTVVVRPFSSSFFGLAQVTLTVRILPQLFVLSSRILAIGNSKFLFKITGLDPNFNYQLTCSFRSSVTSNVYSRSVDSVLGSLSLFSCSSPAIDAAGAAWTFSVSSAAANFTLVETSQILVSDLLRLDASDVDSSAGRDVPISFAFARQEPLSCKLSSPLSITSRSLELTGGAYATIPGPSSLNLHEFSISLWIKASSAIKHDVWSDVLSNSNGFSISISSSNQSSANSVKIKFCVFLSINVSVSENCAISSDLPIRNVWTHIFVGVNGAFGRTVLIVNNVDTFEAFRVEPFSGANFHSSSIVLGQKFSSTGADIHPYDGLIDNIRIFSVFVAPNLVSEMYERSFSVYPPANMSMSLTFDDNVGRDEVSGQIISIQKLPFSTLKGQWFSICSHLASGSVFSYSTLYNLSHYSMRSSDYIASSWIRYLASCFCHGMHREA